MIERLKNMVLKFLLNRSKSRLLLYFLVFNLLLLLAALILIPLQTRALEKAALDSRQQISLKRNTLKNLEKVDAIESFCDNYRQRFMEREQFSAVLRDLAVMAERQKVEIISVDYKHLPDRRENLQEVSMDMVVRGPYSLIRRFLYAVKDYKVPLVIKELAISSSKRDRTSDNKIELKIGIVTYFR